MPILRYHPQQPKEGHYFPDPSGNTIRAKNVDALLKAIVAFRNNNAMPAGNPVAEVEAFYSVQFPWLVVKFNQGEVTPPPATKEADDPLRPWINRQWKNPPTKWQESEKARQRLDNCKACPHYQSLGIVSDVNLRRLIILGAGRMDVSLLHCDVHRWAVGLAVWLEDPEVLTDVEGCWAKTMSPVFH